MWEKFKAWSAKIFFDPCQHCGKATWKMEVNRRKTYRGVIVRIICEDCVKIQKRRELKEKIQEVIHDEYNEDTRRHWF